jgi:hypothetical protein
MQCPIEWVKESNQKVYFVSGTVELRAAAGLPSLPASAAATITLPKRMRMSSRLSIFFPVGEGALELALWLEEASAWEAEE